jgi:hypothetical protein
MPTAKRSVRNVNGGAYCKPTFVARKPDPQTTTKYQASHELELRCETVTSGIVADAGDCLSPTLEITIEKEILIAINYASSTSLKTSWSSQ